MTGRKHLFTSESVTEGHPDKLADQISDAVLDTIMAQDKQCRVACETLVTTGLVVIAGEITANCQIEMPEVARSVIREVGYDSTEVGFDWKTCSVVAAIDKQSLDIARGVDKGTGLHSEQGAGDQGLMFGYACTETEELMPMPISYAHLLTKRLAEVRKNGTLPFIRPDGKSQVSVEYQDDVPCRVDTIVISTQHSEDIEQSALKEAVIEEVIRKVIPPRYLKSTKYFINPTGRFVEGGPRTDTGLTGRKIIVDSYGGMGRMGGGAFSGKDPSKVDRSAAYMARYIAKNIVAAGLATRCEVQFAYAIGVAKPVSVFINTLGTGFIPDQQIERIVDEMFDLRPAAIISTLDLLRPIYLKTASYGHFRAEPEFSWENADRAEELRDRCGLGPLQTEKAACGS